MSDATDDRFEPVSLPVDRWRAARRGVTFLAPGVGVSILFVWLVSRLTLEPSGVSNRITQYALACVYIAIVLGGLAIVWRGAYWLIVALWPRPLRILFESDVLRIDLGPMGGQRYDVARITAVYPFDDPEEADDGVYEALRDPEAYVAEHLPKMTHPNAVSHLDVMIRHLVTVEEATLAKLLKPFIDRCHRPVHDDNSVQTTDPE